jgi:serine phosphatase RsbU (regulator of sigma subunit)
MYRHPGRFARGAEGIDLLDGVAPDELADRLIAEAERLTGAPAAVYIVEVEGRLLLRVADSDSFPDQLRIPHTVGVELTRETDAEMRKMVAEQLGEGTAIQPLWLGARAQVVLMTAGGHEGALAELVREGGAAIDLANRCTDVFHRARRRRRMQAAAELQKDMMPPSVGVVRGAELATAIMPAYEVGGDFCDWAQNPEGTRLGIADAVGKGGPAMSLSAIALGALRSSRRSGDSLADTARAIDQEVRGLGRASYYLTAVLAAWNPETRTVTWLRLGHPPPLLIDGGGRVHELEDGYGNVPLGLFAEHTFELECSSRALAPGEQFVLYSDGVTERRGADGGRFGLAGVREAVARMTDDSAAGTVRAILTAVREMAEPPPGDDATMVVLRTT